MSDLNTTTISRKALLEQERLPRGSDLRSAKRSSGPTVFFAIVGLFPVLGIFGLLALVLSLSVRENGSPSGEITWQNFQQVFSNPQLVEVIGNTVLHITVTVLIALVIGTALAVFIERTDFGFSRLINSFTLLRILIPGFFTAMGWLFLAHPRIGVFNIWLEDLFGLESAVFNVTTVVGMGFVEGLSLAGLVFLMVSGSLRNMDSSLEESARTAGASSFTVIRKITLPLIKPALVSSVMFVGTIALSALDVPLVLGLASRTYVFTSFLYISATPDAGAANYGPAATFSTVLVVLAILLSLWYTRVISAGNKYRVLGGKGHRPVRARLSRKARFGISTFVVAYFLLSMVLPMIMVVWASLLKYLQPPSATALSALTFDNYLNLNLDTLARSFQNTAILGLLAPTLAIVMSLAIAMVVIRSRLRFRFVYDFGAFMPQAIPTTIFALSASIVVMYLLKGFGYGTIGLVVVVSALTSIPLASRMINAAVLQIHPELEEAGQMSGANPWQVLWRVTLPLLRPTLLFGWLWIALLAMRDLTLPAMLAGPGGSTLSLTAWTMFNAGQTGPASALTVIMVLAMSPIVILYMLLTRKNEGVSL